MILHRILKSNLNDNIDHVRSNGLVYSRGGGGGGGIVGPFLTTARCVEKHTPWIFQIKRKISEDEMKF